MSKRRASLLFLTLFAIVSGYVAWCARPFYLKPQLTFDADVGPADRTALGKWYEETDLVAPTKFQWAAMWAKLKNPWASGRGRAACDTWHSDQSGEAYMEIVQTGRTTYISLTQEAGDARWVPKRGRTYGPLREVKNDEDIEWMLPEPPRHPSEPSDK